MKHSKERNEIGNGIEGKERNGIGNGIEGEERNEN
jgi:hypothetical protein